MYFLINIEFEDHTSPTIHALLSTWMKYFLKPHFNDTHLIFNLEEIYKMFYLVVFEKIGNS